MSSLETSFRRGTAERNTQLQRNRDGEDEERAAPAAQPASRKPLILAPIRRETLRPRTLAAVAATLLVVGLARPGVASVAGGLPLVVLGEAIRLWAAGHLYKTRELVTSGPYAYLRHPLYLGTLLIGAGLMVMAGPWVAVVAIPVGLLFFFAYYLPYKERVEARRLEAVYGERFRAYRASVRMLWARRHPWRVGWALQPRRWSFERVRDNGEVATAFTVAIAALAVVGAGVLHALL